VPEPTRRPPANDAALCQEVRTRVLGQRRFRRWTVLVDACGGVIGLRGVVDDADDAAAIVEAARAVPGVVGVQDYLHPSDAPPPNLAAGRGRRGGVTAADR
jgi:osmotically-inducible protein OsmY